MADSITSVKVEEEDADDISIPVTFDMSSNVKESAWKQILENGRKYQLQ